ncbi:YifB family Mg chelatase-like AAA ATPase [Nocardioidaceae bacterium]|nr:YifB family Mg chelatase-like AAA ATPase [Nocardioidaceae bacterium]
MGIATAHTVVLAGAVGHRVDVQVDVSMGQVNTLVVGRPDASINEARDRCRTAVDNSGFRWPTTRRTTILLSPADLPKRGSHLDLAIAVAVLVAAEDMAASLAGTALIGELALDGAMRPVVGVLPMVLAARAQGLGHVIVPEPQAAEAALVPGMAVTGVRSLAQAVAVLTGEEVPPAPPVAVVGASPMLGAGARGPRADLDLADLIGVVDARHALEVAAAGGHHLMLSGPKGAGKTSLAERLPGLLPDLDVEEALELTALVSLASATGSGAVEVEGLVRRPPFSAPHHTSSRTSVLGGGSGRVRPGEISKAHRGVLFLDEFPLFHADIVEALRQPLESGEITIARGEEVATFPARAGLVLACNPCPCGEWRPDDRHAACSCTEVARRRYRAKISGPIADRIDITRHVMPVSAWEARDPLAARESSAVVRARVTAARERQRRRYAGTPWRVNADVPGAALREQFPLSEAATTVLDEQLYSGRLTHRGSVRVHRLAWTLADLRLEEPCPPDVSEVRDALALRLGEPLPDASLTRRAGAAR